MLVALGTVPTLIGLIPNYKITLMDAFLSGLVALGSTSGVILLILFILVVLTALFRWVCTGKWGWRDDDG